MKRLFTLISALLLCQFMVVAQNFLHVYSGDTRLAEVPTAELDSVTVRDTEFYNEGWVYVGKGTYEFTQAFTGTSSSTVYKRQVSEGKWQYKFENWLVQDFDLIIDYDASTGRCHVQPQATGYNHDSYGMIMAADGATYTGEEENYPSYFVENNNTFEIFMVYYVDAGTFGYGYEYLLLEETSAAPARERKLDVTIEMNTLHKEPVQSIRKAASRRSATQSATLQQEGQVSNKQLQPITTREITR